MKVQKDDCAPAWKNSQPSSPEAEQSLFLSFIETEKDTDEGPCSASKSSVSAGLEEATKTANLVPNKAKSEISPGLYLTQNAGKIQLSGPAVDANFRAQLEAWLKKTVKD